jgi:soluble lytic murein transglycosylase-like protein
MTPQRPRSPGATTAAARVLPRALAVAALAGSLLATTARADCVTDAAALHGVNEGVLRAILWNESHMNGAAVNRNTDGSIDVGIGQMNSQHFGELRRLGVTPQMLLEPCIGTYVAAWHLSKQVKVLGNTWKAVGAYHSSTPLYNQGYANGVAATLKTWGLIDPTFWPFPDAPKSATEAHRLLRGPGGPPSGATPAKRGKSASRTITVDTSSSIISLSQ